MSKNCLCPVILKEKTDFFIKQKASTDSPIATENHTMKQDNSKNKPTPADSKDMRAYITIQQATEIGLTPSTKQTLGSLTALRKVKFTIDGEEILEAALPSV